MNMEYISESRELFTSLAGTNADAPIPSLIAAPTTSSRNRLRVSSEFSRNWRSSAGSVIVSFIQLKRFLYLAILLLSLTPNVARAQAWSGILSPGRAIDWTQAGAGTIPNRTTICSTVAAYGSAASPQPGTAINNAIASCPSGQVVSLGAGTFYLSSGITFAGKNNVTLRGAGPNQTFIIFSGNTDCGGTGWANICAVASTTNDSSNWVNAANWTAGYAQGTTTITLDGVPNLAVGSILILDQCNSGLSGKAPSGSGLFNQTDAGCLSGTVADNGNLFICSLTGTCALEGATSSGRGATPSGTRGQRQLVKVTSISGSGPYTVRITPGLYAPNWNAGQSPGAYWANGPPITGVGIENLSLDNTGDTTLQGAITFFNAYGCWVKNIRSLNPSNKHFVAYQSNHNTVRDSYFYGTQRAASESYGTDNGYSAGDNLFENNIFQHVASPMLNEGAVGSVHSYNYATDDFYTKLGQVAWQQANDYEHAVGNMYLLWEGDQGIAATADDIHGTADFITHFRNYYNGRDPQGGSVGGKTQQTNAFQLQAFNRYFNLIGNVLGTSGYHTNYQVHPSSTTDPGSASASDLSIYSLGYSGNEGTFQGSIANDTVLFSTLMRWGNYDTVNAAVQWNSSEVPSGPSPYGNPLPGSQTLPPSFVYSSRPAWWSTPWGTPPWPANGPDVTGGNILGTGGHANNIPAQLCYANSPIDSNYPGAAGRGVLLFNANNCYSMASTLPAPPTNMTATVQ